MNRRICHFSLPLLSLKNYSYDLFMNKILMIILASAFLGSCAFMRESGKHRNLQTQILSSITSKSSEFAKCAERSDLYQKLGDERIRVILTLNISKRGDLEKFQLDDKDYPGEFTDCIFGILELINFPSNEEGRLVEIEQPFIFSKRL